MYIERRKEECLFNLGSEKLYEKVNREKVGENLQEYEMETFVEIM